MDKTINENKGKLNRVVSIYCQYFLSLKQQGIDEFIYLFVALQKKIDGVSTVG